MYDKQEILGIVEKALEGTPHYVVEFDVNAANRITVFVDSDESVSIDFCVELSKKIEQSLDREKEDFELLVSSAGLSEGFKIPRQYKKYIGKQVEVHLPNGPWLRGELKSAGDENFVIETEEMVKVEGKKKKQRQVSEKQFAYDEVNMTRLFLDF